MEKFKLNTIEEAIEDFREGKFVIVVDDEDRENEGDLICAAEKITPEMVNFMLKYARGVLCAPITISRSRELDLPGMEEPGGLPSMGSHRVGHDLSALAAAAAAAAALLN